MRKLGLIGGLSWVSTGIYYERINKAVAKARGGLTSAPLVLESLDFAAFSAAHTAGDWDKAGDMLAAAGSRLTQAGAEGIALCSNAAHHYYDALAAAVAIPVIHIADVTAAKLVADGVKRAGLLGTRFTMAEPFYRDRIEAHGIQVTVPEPAMMAEVDRIIFEELALGKVSRVSQRTLKTAITNLAQARNQAVILGCTELAMLVDTGANVLPVYDTTALHSAAAADWILGG